MNVYRAATASVLPLVGAAAGMPDTASAATAPADAITALDMSCLPTVTTSWGEGVLCGDGDTYSGYVLDTLSDGHCVNADYRANTSDSWHFMSQSCGDKANFSIGITSTVQVRMVRTGAPNPWVFLWQD